MKFNLADLLSLGDHVQNAFKNPRSSVYNFSNITDNQLEGEYMGEDSDRGSSKSQSLLG